MATYNSGQVKFGTPGAVIDSTIPSRRLYDFSDRVADLAPEESPFFVYLSKVGKVPTSDSQFRFLEDRSKIAMTDRSFLQKGGGTLAAAGSNTTLTVDTSGGADTEAITQATARIESVTQNSSDTTIVVKTIANSAGSGTTTLDDNGECVVIGTSYEQGSGSPDVWSQELDNDYGYTQIFKTACEMSNTARATQYRGYADEWQRLWNLKLREHKIDIERAMLFGMRGSQSGIQYTEGIVGNILVNGTATTDGTIGSYSEGVPYLASYAVAELTYDGLLAAFETMYDPARGGSSAKLCLASLPVVSHFNKLSGFMENSMVATETAYNFERSQGSFGHKIMKIETVHGDCSIVKEPLFRNNASGHMCFVDLDNVSYRPLVGNGVNRDTSIQTNVQAGDEDLRKDMILTEAGLEVSLPESHALINLETV